MPGEANRDTVGRTVAIETVGLRKVFGDHAAVAGLDLATMTTKGHIRTDDNALRFVEVVVNGPKSWSLAAS